MISIEYSAYFLHYHRIAAAPNCSCKFYRSFCRGNYAPARANDRCRCRDIAGRACLCNGEGFLTVSLAPPVHFHGRLVTDAAITMVMAASSKWQELIVMRGVIWPRWEQQ